MNALDLIKKHEGTGPKLSNGNFLPYDDSTGKKITLCTVGLNGMYQSKGKATIGYGINLDEGLEPDIVEILTVRRINKIIPLLSKFTFWIGLSPNRQAALIDMVYNLGFGGFCEFHNLLHALEAGDYDTAAKEMRLSDAYREAPDRYTDLSNIMIGG